MKKLLLLLCFLVITFISKSQISYNIKSAYFGGNAGTDVKDTTNYCSSNPCPRGTIIYGTGRVMYIRGQFGWQPLAGSSSTTFTNGLSNIAVSTGVLGGTVTSERRLNSALSGKVLSIYNTTPRQRFYGNGDVKFGDSTNFFWDNTNKQLILNRMRIFSNGSCAGCVDPPRSYSVIMGDSAGNFASDFEHVVAIGGRAMRKNTTGAFQVGVGPGVFEFNTTGSQNNAFGSEALAHNTTGLDNQAFGHDALLHNGTGNRNIAIGTSALSSANNSSNIAIGYQALFTSLTDENIAIGNNAISLSNTGTGNTVIGFNSMVSASSDYNTVMGWRTASAQTSGTRNVILGAGASSTSSTASQNVIIGTSAGQGISSGSGNVFIGNESGGTADVSNKLFIANSNTNSPLLGGDFSTGIVTNSNGSNVIALNHGGSVTVTDGIDIGSIAHAVMGLSSTSDNTSVGFNISDPTSNQITWAIRPFVLRPVNDENLVLGKSGWTGSLQIPALPTSPTGANDVWNNNGILSIGSTTTILSGSATLDFTPTAAGTTTDLTITVTGASLNDVVSLGVPNGSTSFTNAANSYYAWVSSADTVTVRFSNNTAATPLDPASGTFKVKVFK